MRRAIPVAVALVVLALAPAASGSAACSTHLTWHAAAYRAVSTAGSVKAGRALGNGTLHTCSTTNLPPGYPAPTARVGADALARPGLAGAGGGGPVPGRRRGRARRRPSAPAP